MGLRGKILSEREKAALYYHIFGGLDDWKQLYKIANPEADTGQEIKFLDTYVSRWKNSDKVKNFVQYLQIIKTEGLAEEKKKAGKEDEKRREESEHTEMKKEKIINIVDYSDPKNRQRLYNEVIARSKEDPKTQLDAAKMFEQIQKDDREAAKAQKQTRFYLPLRCESCPLYLQKATK